jgi:hypothetical protein
MRQEVDIRYVVTSLKGSAQHRPSSATSLPSPFFFSRSQPEDVDLGSFGRGQALQRIALYPVRVRTPSSHNQYSRLPKA